MMIIITFLSMQNILILMKLMLLKQTQRAFTCSKLTIETLEQGVKYVQANNKDTRATSMMSI